jgi:hypothetical protein
VPLIDDPAWHALLSENPGFVRVDPAGADEQGQRHTHAYLCFHCEEPKHVENSRHAHHELHSGHFAFMRAAVQGVDARASWDRYLRLEGEHVDARPKVSFGRKG